MSLRGVNLHADGKAQTQTELWWVPMWLPLKHTLSPVCPVYTSFASLLQGEDLVSEELQGTPLGLMARYTCSRLPCGIGKHLPPEEDEVVDSVHVLYGHLKSRLPEEAFLSDVLSPHLWPDGIVCRTWIEQGFNKCWLLVLTHAHGSRHNEVHEKNTSQCSLYLSVTCSCNLLVFRTF